MVVETFDEGLSYVLPSGFRPCDHPWQAALPRTRILRLLPNRTSLGRSFYTKNRTNCKGILKIVPSYRNLLPLRGKNRKSYRKPAQPPALTNGEPRELACQGQAYRGTTAYSQAKTTV